MEERAVPYCQPAPGISSGQCTWWRRSQRSASTASGTWSVKGRGAFVVLLRSFRRGRACHADRRRTLTAVRSHARHARACAARARRAGSSLCTSCSLGPPGTRDATYAAEAHRCASTLSVRQARRHVGDCRPGGVHRAWWTPPCGCHPVCSVLPGRPCRGLRPRAPLMPFPSRILRGLSRLLAAGWGGTQEPEVQEGPRQGMRRRARPAGRRTQCLQLPLRTRLTP
jgi:hypothetical protein